MSLPPFQAFQEKVFDTVTHVMGYDASWTPVSGGSALTARVNFKIPHSDAELAGFAYSPKMIIAEWKKGDLSGLEESFASNNEKITVNDILYNVIHVKAMFDGQTFQAVLEVS
jgi:hypothetical protein